MSGSGRVYLLIWQMCANEALKIGFGHIACSAELILVAGAYQIGGRVQKKHDIALPTAARRRSRLRATE